VLKSDSKMVIVDIRNIY